MLALGAHRTKTHSVLSYKMLTYSHLVHLLAWMYDGRNTNVAKPRC